jgi:hypothetical protein
VTRKYTTAKLVFTPPPPDNEHGPTPGTDSSAAEGAVAGKVDTPPPIVLASATNLIQLQKQLKGQIFESRSTTNGVITKDIVDYQSVKYYFKSNNLSYYTFYPKSENPINAVRCQPLVGLWKELYPLPCFCSL